MKAFLILILGCLNVSHAEKIEIHKKEMTTIISDVTRFEARVHELKGLKDETQDGPTLENIVSEIADLQKKLLDLRRRKTNLTTHLKTAHSEDDRIAVMSLMRDSGEKNKTDKAKKADPQKDVLEERLNKLMQQIQLQYARTAKDREEFVKKAKVSAEAPVVIDVSKGPKKKREILQEDKDRYLKESIQTKMKIEVPEEKSEDLHKEGEEKPTSPPAEPAHH